MNANDEVNVPRGIEVLVKKASVDPAFKELLLSQRAAAAGQIDLPLDPAEAMMLDNIPVDQLRAIIDQTHVPEEHRRAFLGKAAAAMLAAIGVSGAGEAMGGTGMGGSFGIRVQVPKKKPTEKPPPPIEGEVIGLIAKELSLSKERITRESRLGPDLKADEKQREAIRQALEKEFAAAVPNWVFDDLRTVSEVIDYVVTAREVQPLVVKLIAKRFHVAEEQVTFSASLTDLKVDARKLAHLRTALQSRFGATLPPDEFYKSKTVGDVAGCVTEAVRRRRAGATRPQPPPFSRGVRPDRIPVPEGIRPDRIPAPTGSRPDPPPR